MTKRVSPRASLRAFLSFTVSCAAVCAGTVSAQTINPAAQNGKIAEIVVTAERRVTTAQKTAAAISVRTGKLLAQQGRDNLNQILEDVPGVSTQPPAPAAQAGTDVSGSGIVIRGVPSNSVGSGQNISGVPATAVYVDDIINGVGQTLDIDRVEVLRGPQGTLYGRSATAGVVAIHTHDPDLTHLGGSLSGEFGSYALRHVTGVVNLPLISGLLALRVAADDYNRDGYEDRISGAVNYNQERAKLLYRPSDDFSVLLAVAQNNNLTHAGGLAGHLTGPNQFTYLDDSPIAGGRNAFRQYWGELNWNLGPASLTYIPAARTWYQKADQFIIGPGGYELEQPISTPHDEFITQELRLTSEPGSPINWQTGAFYYHNNLLGANLIKWYVSQAPLVDSAIRRTTQNEGAFAEATYPLRSDLRLTGGLRYDYTSVRTSENYGLNTNLLCGTPAEAMVPFCATAPIGENLAGMPSNVVPFSLSGNAGKRLFRNVTYKARLEYDVAPSHMIYALVASGFLPGDVQVGSGAGNQPVPVVLAAETLTSYEIGSKNRFLGNRLEANGDAFYYDYGGYQTQVVLDPLNPSSVSQVAVPMKMAGVEGELLYRVTPSDSISLNGSYVHTKLDKSSPAIAAAISQTSLWNDVPGNLNIGYDHVIDLADGGSIDLHGDMNWRSAYEVSQLSVLYATQYGQTPYADQGAVALGNFSATWQSAQRQWSISAYLRNVSDVRYKETVLPQIVPTPTGLVNNDTGSQSDPRTFGAVMSVYF